MNTSKSSQHSQGTTQNNRSPSSNTQNQPTQPAYSNHDKKKLDIPAQPHVPDSTITNRNSTRGNNESEKMNRKN